MICRVVLTLVCLCLVIFPATPALPCAWENFDSIRFNTFRKNFHSPPRLPYRNPNQDWSGKHIDRDVSGAVFPARWDDPSAWYGKKFYKERDEALALFEEALTKEGTRERAAALALYRKFILAADEKDLAWNINFALERIDLFSRQYRSQDIDEYLYVKQPFYVALSDMSRRWEMMKDLLAGDLSEDQDSLPERRTLSGELFDMDVKQNFLLARKQLLKLKDKPGFPLHEFVLYSLGALAYQDKDYESALNWFNQIIKNYHPQSPRYDDALFMLGKSAYRAFWTQEEAEPGSGDKSLLARAEKIFRNVAENHRDSFFAPDSLGWLGRLCLKNGNCEGALQAYQSIIKEYPDRNIALKAERWIEEVLQEVPFNSEEVLNGILRRAKIEARFLYANQRYFEIIENHPQSPYLLPAIYNYLHNNQVDRNHKFSPKSLQTIKKTIDQLIKNPAFKNYYPELMTRLSNLYLEMGRFQDAVAAASKVLKLHPQNKWAPEACLVQGIAYKKTGQVSPAIKSFERLTTKYKESILARAGLEQLAQLYEETNQLDEALKIYLDLGYDDARYLLTVTMTPEQMEKFIKDKPDYLSQSIPGVLVGWESAGYAETVWRRLIGIRFLQDDNYEKAFEYFEKENSQIKEIVAQELLPLWQQLQALPHPKKPETLFAVATFFYRNPQLLARESLNTMYFDLFQEQFLTPEVEKQNIRHMEKRAAEFKAGRMYDNIAANHPEYEKAARSLYRSALINIRLCSYNSVWRQRPDREKLRQHARKNLEMILKNYPNSEVKKEAEQWYKHFFKARQPG